MNDGNAPAKVNKAMIAIIITLCVVVVAAIIVIVLLLRKTDDKPKVDDGRATVITESNSKDVVNEINKPVEDGYFETSQSIDWHFKNGTSVDAFIENSTNNTRTVFFDLMMEDSEEMIYSSPYIPVGKALESVTLDKELEAGTYETIMIYHLVDDNNEEVSSLQVGLTIYVE